jgi:hypothetical protein
MPPYSLLLAPVVPMNGLTLFTLDVDADADAAFNCSAAAGLAALIGGTSAATSATAVSAFGHNGIRRGRPAGGIGAG